LVSKNFIRVLDKPTGTDKIPEISCEIFLALDTLHKSLDMTPIPPSIMPEKGSNMPQCKHPRVQIVSREEDEEFVECLECREIFESSEFKDMAIEEKAPESDS
jgi:hypothetical protein